VEVLPPIGPSRAPAFPSLEFPSSTRNGVLAINTLQP
jgi:hypothetical protein